VYDRQTGGTERVSVDSVGIEGNSNSWIAAISADGRFVAFESDASNLVTGDTNFCFGQSCRDIFVHDRQSGVTERVSVDSAGNQGNGFSDSAAISDDGRYVAFTSFDSNLVPGDDNNAIDVFVHDRQSGTTERVSVDSAGVQSNGSSGWMGGLAISGDGRHVAFFSDATNLVTGDTNGQRDVFVHDRASGVTARVSVDSADNQGNDFSSDPAISGDGRYVAFYSSATNLVLGDTNGVADIFVHDRGPVTPTPTPSPGTAVGGVVQLVADADAPTDVSGSSPGRDYAMPIAGLAAAALIALGVGGWHARRRWLR
jgi:Tol biopolymer transport system component